MNRICIIEPHLTDYSHPVFLELAEYCNVDIVVSPTPPAEGFGTSEPLKSSKVRYFVVPRLTPFGKKIGLIQWGVGRYIVRERPDVILTFSNPRYVSFWITLFLGRLLRIPIFAYGHGLFKKRRIGVLHRLVVTAVLRLVQSYICYAPIVRQSFIDHGFSDRKLSVVHNSLINRFPVYPEEKTGKECGILFVGRIRPGSGLELLIRVIDRVRHDAGLSLSLHLIGSGEETERVQQKAHGASWVILHGEVYNQEEIRRISLECFAGCHPGNAGLSVVHMLSLSLPVVTHDDLSSHGPEPSFLHHGVDAVLYDHANAEESLYRAICLLASDRIKLSTMQHAAFDAYKNLVNPPLAARFWSILSGGEEFISAAVESNGLEIEKLGTQE